jgi:hypothetical protein
MSYLSATLVPSLSLRFCFPTCLHTTTSSTTAPLHGRSSFAGDLEAPTVLPGLAPRASGRSGYSWSRRPARRTTDDDEQHDAEQSKRPLSRESSGCSCPKSCDGFAQPRVPTPQWPKSRCTITSANTGPRRPQISTDESNTQKSRSNWFLIRTLRQALIP